MREVAEVAEVAVGATVVDFNDGRCSGQEGHLVLLLTTDSGASADSMRCRLGCRRTSLETWEIRDQGDLCGSSG